MDLPVLKGVEQVSDGWLKKYVLTYEFPDGRGLNYEVGVAQRARAVRFEDARQSRAAASSTDAVCIVGHTAERRLSAHPRISFSHESDVRGVSAGFERG